MKFKLLVIAISVMSLSCTTTQRMEENNSSTNINVKNKKTITAHIIKSGNENVNISAHKEITLEQIMSNPDWFGRGPESWYWGDDSETIFYKQKRAGNILRDLYSKKLDEQENGHQVNLTNLHKVADQYGIINTENTHEVYIFQGNLFLKTLSTGHVQQLTHTSAIETSPSFLINGDIAYRVGNVFYHFDLKNNQIKELANLLMTNDSEQITTSNPPSDSSYLAKEQKKLIKYLQLQEKNTQLIKDQKRSWRVSNNTITQTNFYFNKNQKIVHASLSPTGKHLIVSVTSDEILSKNSDVMPDYISQSGDISVKSVRNRVADNSQYSEAVYLLDIIDGTMQLLSFDNLPGYDEDVLAHVRTENYKRNGKVYKSVKAFRHIHVMDAINPIQWNDAGDNAAILFEAWDNKDRWLATVNLETKNLVTQHRLHDDAWINWSFNEFGWLNKKGTEDQLYYLSEESGYSHLYVKPINGKAKQLTSGQFELSDLTLSTDEKSLFYRANRKHPGIYEIYQIDIDSGDIKAITNLGGNNTYQLSPDNSKLLISHSTVNMPPELYVEMVNNKPEAIRLTYTVSEEFLSMPWSIPSIVTVNSSNQADPIYSKVYLPEGYDKTNKKHKAVMFSHGAGYLQNADLGWSGYFREYMFHSMLVQKGYVVIDMDYRASAGYGSDWRTAIYRHMGKPEIEDMQDGVNWLVENANVDRNRIGTYGGSYGGFLTLMSMFTQPDLFQSGSALRLVSDWAYYNHGYTSNILNTPADDPIAYERSSPIYFAEGLQKPLLINAPMVDDNVFFQDTVRLVQRLIELEKEDFETAIYPVEPHGFVQPSSWLNEYRRIFKLFENTL